MASNASAEEVTVEVFIGSRRDNFAMLFRVPAGDSVRLGDEGFVIGRETSMWVRCQDATILVWGRFVDPRRSLL
jgi:hypothetical protein